MIERDLDVPPGIDAVRIGGTVTRQEFTDTVDPLLQAAVREHRQLRLMCVVDESFTGMTPAAVWEDLRAGATALRHLAGYALVSDLAWVRASVRLATFFLPGHFRVFPVAERTAALSWLADLPCVLAAVRRLDDRGVIVVDLDQPLRREDVDVITSAVDDWLATHAELPGLVLHAPAFPGWENLSGLLHHLRFVAGHQRRVQRVALVVPGPGIDLAAGVASSVLHPDVLRVADLDNAVRWAGVAPAGVG